MYLNLTFKKEYAGTGEDPQALSEISEDDTGDWSGFKGIHAVSHILFKLIMD